MYKRQKGTKNPLTDERYEYCRSNFQRFDFIFFVEISNSFEFNNVQKSSMDRGHECPIFFCWKNRPIISGRYFHFCGTAIRIHLTFFRKEKMGSISHTERLTERTKCKSKREIKFKSCKKPRPEQPPGGQTINKRLIKWWISVTKKRKDRRS